MPRRKVEPQEVAPEVERAPEVKPPVETKPTPEVKPATEARPTPTVKSISWEEFERFTESKREKTSWVKEAVKRAQQGPVMLEGLNKGQIMALINYVDRYNFESANTPKIAYKYDVKKGVVLLAPVKQ